MAVSMDRTEGRVVFLDNLRYLFVLLVILEHSSNAYTNVIWWPVADRNTSIIAGWVSAFSDAVSMPLLFYIAGYFAIPVIQKRGASSFLKGKLRRLGIPWLLCILTICPILPLIYHYTRNGLTLSTSYWDLWVDLMRDAARFNVGIIISMKELMMNNHFFQRYMWFLSLLFLFFFLFAIIYLINKNWFDRHDRPIKLEQPSVLAVLKLMAIVGFATVICSFLVMAGIMVFGPKGSDPEPFFTLGNIIQFRPSRLFSFLIYFGLGAITYRNKWIERRKFPGHFKTWMISFFLCLFIYLFVKSLMLKAPTHSREIYGAAFIVILNFLTISTLGFFSSIAIRYWSRPAKIDRNLAANSYNMYLSHYIFVLVFQLILFTIPEIPILLKFAIVSAFSFFCAYLVSQFLIKPFPKLTVALLSIMLIVMFVVIKP